MKYTEPKIEILLPVRDAIMASPDLADHYAINLWDRLTESTPHSKKDESTKYGYAIVSQLFVSL